MRKLSILLVYIVFATLISFALAEGNISAHIDFESPIGLSGENPRFLLVNETLYSFSKKEGQILSWTIGDSAITQYSSLPAVPIESSVMQYKEMSVTKQIEMEAIVTHVFAGNDKLWGLNQYSGKFGPISEEGIEYSKYSLDLSGLYPNSNHDSDVVYSGYVSGNSLFLFSLLMKDSLVAEFDISTGVRKNTSLEFIGYASEFREGKAFYRVNIQSADRAGGYTEKLYELDLATGNLIPMALPVFENANEEIQLGGAYYLPETSVLYLAASTSIGIDLDMRLFAGAAGNSYSEVLQLPRSRAGFYSLCRPVDPGKVIAVDAYGATVFDIDETFGRN